MDVPSASLGLGGIYRILNNTTGKCYIGSTKNFEQRLYQHTLMLENDVHHSRYLQRSWNHHSPGVFVFEVIEHVDDINLLKEREQFHMDVRFETKGSIEYNMTRHANRTDELTELAILAMRRERDAFDEMVLDAVLDLGWSFDFVWGATIASQKIAQHLQVSWFRVNHALRRLKKQGVIVLPRRSHIIKRPEQRPATEKKLAAARANILKAQAKPGPLTEDGRRRRSEASRRTQERLRQTGPTPAQLAYWKRLSEISFDRMSERRQQAWLDTRHKSVSKRQAALERAHRLNRDNRMRHLREIYDELRQIGQAPILNKGVYQSAQDLATHFNKSVKTMYKALRDLQKLKKISFGETVRFWSEQRRKTHEAQYGPDVLVVSGKTQTRVYEAIPEIGWKRVSDLIEEMGLSDVGVRFHLRRLVAKHQIEWVVGKVRRIDPDTFKSEPTTLRDFLKVRFKTISAFVRALDLPRFYILAFIDGDPHYMTSEQERQAVELLGLSEEAYLAAKAASLRQTAEQPSPTPSVSTQPPLPPAQGILFGEED